MLLHLLTLSYLITTPPDRAVSHLPRGDGTRVPESTYPSPTNDTTMDKSLGSLGLKLWDVGS